MSAWRWLALIGALPACSSHETAEPAAPPERGALALTFDGLDDYATLGTAAFPFAEAQQSATAWLEWGPSTTTEQVVLALRKDFASGFVLGFRAGTLEVWSAYSGRSYVASPEAFPTGEWHHVGYVFDGAEHHLYVDGALVASGDYSPNNRTPTSGWIGSIDGRGWFFQGKLDALRIWSAARSADEMDDEAAGTLSGDRSTLVADLAFDELEGGRAFDDSGLGNHATLGDGDFQRSPARVPSTR